MDVVWRGPIPENNYTIGRDGSAVELIVDHWTVVMFEGAIRRFKDPASRLSAHYVIGQDGTTYLAEKPANINVMVEEIRKRYRNTKSVYLKADRRTPWDQVAQVIATLGEAKLAVNVVTQPEDQTGKK